MNIVLRAEIVMCREIVTVVQVILSFYPVFAKPKTKRIRLFDIILGWCVFCFSWKIQTTKIVNSYCVFDVLVRRFRYKTSDEPGLFSLNYDMKHGKFSFTARGTFCLYN